MTIKLQALIIVFIILNLLYSINCIDIKLDKTRIAYVTDIHLDIFFNPNSNFLQCKIQNSNSEFITTLKLNITDLGKPFCNTNINLFHKMISELKKEHLKNPISKILILGDSVTHYLNNDKKNLENNYIKTYEKIQNVFKLYLPEVETLFTLGNNDFPERNNFPDSTNNYNKYMSWLNINMFSKQDEAYKLKNVIIEDKEVSLYIPFYKYRLTDKIVFLFINSVMFGLKSNQNTEYSKALLFNQIEFLKTELYLLKSLGIKCIINAHIPIYGQFHYSPTQEEWKYDFNKIFDDLAFEYRSTIIWIFFAHFHEGCIAVRSRIIKDKIFRYMPSICLTSISPSNGTNPGFTIVTIDNTNSEIESIDQKYLLNFNSDSPTFKDFSLKDKNFLKEFSANEVYNYLRRRDESLDIFSKYYEFLWGFRLKLPVENIDVSKYDLMKGSSYFFTLDEFYKYFNK